MAIGRFIEQQARQLPPGCFAAVMATGIASIDAGRHGMAWLARALFALNVLMFAWLLALSLLRLFRFRREVVADFVDPARGAGFLTFVAAACVLGSQFAQVVPVRALAGLLGLIAAIAWLALIYLFLATAITRPGKPDFMHAINGGWLVAVVATQGLAVLATLLSAPPQADTGLLFAALCLYLLGGALYLPIITLVLYRLVFLPLSAREFTPPYWINMGALAISTLAGSLIVSRTSPASPLADLMPFVKGLTLFFWATASWWIPLLAILWLWRHLWQRVPLRYDAADWNIVFPIGMYTVGTVELAHALRLHFLLALGAIGDYVNLLLWALVAAGFVMHAVRGTGAAARSPCGDAASSHRR